MNCKLLIGIVNVILIFLFYKSQLL